MVVEKIPEQDSKVTGNIFIKMIFSYFKFQIYDFINPANYHLFQINN